MGVITLGQSPHPELEQAFVDAASTVRVRVRGALDGLGPQEIADLARRRTDAPVLVRLVDGSTRTIGMEWLHPLVERLARELMEADARLIVIACTGDFPPCRCEVPILQPSVVCRNELAARSPRARVGIVAPVEAEARVTAARWLADGFLPVVTWASPRRHVEVMRAGQAMRDADVDVVMLDDLGHDVGSAEEFARRCGKTVVTARALVARAVQAELLTR
ncbi:MAG: AroM family protein [Gemmatimonadaceae bacterium]|nr:AroM family protein [Gemmatimonadaceae bacterium]